MIEVPAVASRVAGQRRSHCHTADTQRARAPRGGAHTAHTVMSPYSHEDTTETLRASGLPDLQGQSRLSPDRRHSRAALPAFATDGATLTSTRDSPTIESARTPGTICSRQVPSSREP